MRPVYIIALIFLFIGLMVTDPNNSTNNGIAMIFAGISFVLFVTGITSSLHKKDKIPL